MKYRLFISALTAELGRNRRAWAIFGGEALAVVAMFSTLSFNGQQQLIAQEKDAASGRELLTLKGHTSTVWGVAFSPNGKSLGSGSWDHTVKIWDSTNGQETLTFKGHTGAVMNVTFSQDGKRLASAALSLGHGRSSLSLAGVMMDLF